MLPDPHPCRVGSLCEVSWFFNISDYISVFFLSKISCIGVREEGKERIERDRRRFVVPFIDAFIGWLLYVVCALTGNRTRNLGVWGRHSNQLSYWPGQQLPTFLSSDTCPVTE